MSKLAKALKLHGRPYQTGAYIAKKPIRSADISSKIEQCDFTMGMKYRVRLMLGTEIAVQDPKVTDLAVDSAHRILLKEVFEEYVGPLHEALHLANYGDDQERVAMILRMVLENFYRPEEMPEIPEDSR